MKVRVLYFSALADAAGTRDEELILPNDAKILDVVADVTRLHPAIIPHVASLLVTRNEEWSDRATTLEEGDTVGLMPPVSGG